MKFSVVIPCYKSTSALDALVADILSQYEDHCHEIVLVQDGPDETTLARLQGIASTAGCVKVIQLEKNVGQHQATLCGLQHADSAYFVITMDDDGQVQAEEISKLITKATQSNADITYGLYTERYHSRVRQVISKFFSKTISRYSNIPSQGSSFKLIAPRVVTRLKTYTAPFVYLDEVFAWYSDTTVFTEVNHIPRKEGVSGYSWFKLLRLGWGILLHYTSIPYRIMVYSGFALLIGTIIIGYDWLYHWAMGQFPVFDIPVFILLLCTLAILLVGFGLIRLSQQKKKTDYRSSIKGYQIKLK